MKMKEGKQPKLIVNVTQQRYARLPRIDLLYSTLKRRKQ